MSKESVPQDHSADELHKPGLQKLLQLLGLDITYERGAGDWLYIRKNDGTESKILDLVGGYGSLLLGHQHPELIAEATHFFSSGRPNHTQGTRRTGANQLAQALSNRIQGHWNAVFANSGTEAVEAAIKHAILETGGRTFITVDGGFHGKTLGALQLTSNPQFREAFGLEGLKIIRVPRNNIARLEAAFATAEDLAGFIYEPIQGEAGIRPLSADFLKSAAGLCATRNAPMIADECQTGLGRTGHFLESHALGLAPDYIILSKSLGGGLAKISALLIDQQRYQKKFDFIHSSTFADDEFSCTIAVKALKLIDEALIENCASIGKKVLDSLLELQRQYPDVIADVRGRGLFIGIELQRPGDKSGYILNMLSGCHLLGPMMSSYLLHEHQIRIAPTLSDSMTLRIQPSAFFSEEELSILIQALNALCAVLRDQDAAGLVRPSCRASASLQVNPEIGQDSPAISPYQPEEFAIREKSAQRSLSSTPRVAWLFHMIDEHDLEFLEPSFSSWTRRDRANFLSTYASLACPVMMNAVEIRSKTGQNVRLYPIMLPVTFAAMFRERYAADGSNFKRLVQCGVDQAAAMGCDFVSLGQFTSIVTYGGKTLKNHGMRLTTGNNLTLSLIVQSIERELRRRGLNSRELTLGVVGANGDIGQSFTRFVAPRFRHSILLGSKQPSSAMRLKRLASQNAGSRVASSEDDLAVADVIVCASNSITPTLGSSSFHREAIVCDVSVPPAVQPEVAKLRPDVTLLPGGVVQLPYGEHLNIPGFPLAAGRTYGCMAEGLLLGLERQSCWRGTGPSSAEQARQIAAVAQRHGFELFDPVLHSNNGE